MMLHGKALALAGVSAVRGGRNVLHTPKAAKERRAELGRWKEVLVETATELARGVQRMYRVRKLRLSLRRYVWGVRQLQAAYKGMGARRRAREARRIKAERVSGEARRGVGACR